MKKRTNMVFSILIILLLGFMVYYFAVLRFERVVSYEPGTYDPETGELYIDDSCNVMGINLHGELVTYSSPSDQELDFASGEDIVYELERIHRNENIKAILLEIDSYGGSPVAAEEISNTIQEIKTPVIAMIRAGGTSGAYWVASAAQRIFASKLSDIGGIGVTMSYLDESKLNEKSGYVWNDLSTGKFKDSGSEQKPLTKEERSLFERDLNIIHSEFVKAVSANRNLSLQKVMDLADGSSMLGDMALENGLIDEIGSYTEVENYIRTQYGFEPVFCW